MKNLFALLSALMLSSALAHGGPIPITAPTVITTSGSYIVASDIITGPNQSGITIQANDVRVDLGGHTVNGGILITYLPGTVTGVTNVKVVNGSINSTGQGVEIFGSYCQLAT